MPPSPPPGAGMIPLSLAPAATGAAPAAGAALRRPLACLPENALTIGIAVMMAALGVFRTGEGLGIDWPGHDRARFGFAALFLAGGLGRRAGGGVGGAPDRGAMKRATR